MTHGVGSCSGGGGGGGFTGGGFAYTTHYNFGSRNRGSQDCDNCCKGLAGCICVCVCCRGQDHVNRILIFLSWLVAVFLVAGLSLGVGRFGPTDISTSPTDMMAMTRGINTVFCDGVEVSSSSPVTTYFLPSSPVVTSSHVNYSISKTTQVNQDSFEYWGYYLLSGSNVDIEVCADYSGHMYVIQGHANFNRWKNDDCHDDCTMTSVILGGCTFPWYKKTRDHFHVRDTDEYFIVLANHLLSTFSADIMFNLSRTVYDVDYQTRSCKNSLTCKVDFSGTDSTESIIVFVPKSDKDDVNVTTTCSPRLAVFMTIFLLIPAVLAALFIAYMLYRRGKSSRSSGGDIQQPHERQAVASGTLPPQYQTMTRQSNDKYPDDNRRPPPYGFHEEDVVVKPPSYEEAVSRSDRV